MDSSSLIGLVIMLVSILPVVLAIRSVNKKKRKFTKYYNNKTKANGLLISEQEVWRGAAIGIDKQINRLYFLLQNEIEDLEEIVDLNTVKKCMAEQTPGDTDKSFKLGLRLTFKDAKHPSVYLEFYNSAINTEMDYDHQRIEKWKEIISGQLGK